MTTGQAAPLLAEPAPAHALLAEPGDFSLVLGGPLFQLLRRSRLSGDAFELARRRVVFLALVAWLPLLVLSALGGTAGGGSVAVPFIADVEVHVRFLVALPLLVIAELVVHRRLRLVVRQFLDRQLVPAAARARFDDAVASLVRLRNSTLAELVLVALVYGVGVLVVWRLYAPHDAAAWHTVPAVAGLRLSPAGVWFTFVSLPLFQFLLLRWYFRIFLWARFLWQVSRLPLELVPTHPDRVAGLGFLASAAHAFVPLALAHGALLAGLIATRIVNFGASLADFKFDVVAVVVLVVALVFGPLLALAPLLGRARRDGMRDLGRLAVSSARDFDARWLRADRSAAAAAGDGAELPSLADLGESFEVVRTMRPILATREAFVQVVVATLLPLVPLLFTVMSLQDIVKKLFGILF